MKRFNTFYLSLMSFLVVFEVVGMDLPKDQLLDLFNDAGNALKLCIMKKHNLTTDTIEEFNLTKAITNKITQSYQALATHGLGQEDLNQINNIEYQSTNIPFFQKLKTASLKACLATQPHLLCSLLENTFAKLNCNNQAYELMKTSPKATNEMALQFKNDALSLIEQLRIKVLKSRTPEKVYLQQHSKLLKEIHSFCDKSNQDLLKIITKKVLRICKKANPTSPTKMPNPEAAQSLFGQSTLDPLGMSELMESNFYEPSEDELLESLKATTKEIIKELNKLSELSKVQNLDTVKANIASLIDKMYAQIKQIEKNIPTNSARLLNLQVIKRNIGRLTQETKTLDTKKLIQLIQKIKNKTIANIKKKNSSLALESSSLGLQKTIKSVEIERAKEKRKDIVEKLQKQEAILVDLARSKKIDESYIALLTEYIETLQEYSSHLITAEVNRKEKTEKSIKKYQERLEKAINTVYKLLPYPSLDNTLLISRFFPQINLAIATNNKNELTQAIQGFRKAYHPHAIATVNTSSEQMANEFLNSPTELKKLIHSRMKYDSKNNCKLIPFFLHEIYKHQLAKDDLSQKLAQLTQEDLLFTLGELQISHQWLSPRSKIVNAIISDGLNQQKMQACLMLLNKMCTFYPEIKNHAIEEAIDQIALNSFQSLLKKQSATELNNLVTSTVSALNSLVKIEPTRIEPPQQPEMPQEMLEDNSSMINWEGFDTPQISVELQEKTSEKPVKILPQKDEPEQTSTPQVLIEPAPLTDLSNLVQQISPKEIPQIPSPQETQSIPQIDTPETKPNILTEEDFENTPEKIAWGRNFLEKLQTIKAEIPNKNTKELAEIINNLKGHLATTPTIASQITAQGKSKIYKNIIQTLHNAIQQLAKKEIFAQEDAIPLDYFKNITAQIRLFESIKPFEADTDNLSLITDIINMYKEMLDAGTLQLKEKIRGVERSQQKDRINSYLGNDDILKPYLSQLTNELLQEIENPLLQKAQEGIERLKNVNPVTPPAPAKQEAIIPEEKPEPATPLTPIAPATPVAISVASPTELQPNQIQEVGTPATKRGPLTEPSPEDGITITPPTENPNSQPNVVMRVLNYMRSSISSLWNGILSYFAYVP